MTSNLKRTAGSNPATVNVFVTGQPGVGKTSLVRKVAERLPKGAIAGFYTVDARSETSGERLGLDVVTFSGERAPLCRLRRGCGPKIGKYYVALEEFERLVIPQLTPSTSVKLHIIDELGRMELCSNKFKDACMRLLASPTAVFGSLPAPRYGHTVELVEEIKKRNDTAVLTLTRANRDATADQVERLLLRLIQGEDDDELPQPAAKVQRTEEPQAVKHAVLHSNAGSYQPASHDSHSQPCTTREEAQQGHQKNAEEAGNHSQVQVHGSQPQQTGQDQHMFPSHNQIHAHLQQSGSQHQPQTKLQQQQQQHEPLPPSQQQQQWQQEQRQQQQQQQQHWQQPQQEQHDWQYQANYHHHQQQQQQQRQQQHEQQCEASQPERAHVTRNGDSDYQLQHYADGTLAYPQDHHYQQHQQQLQQQQQQQQQQQEQSHNSDLPYLYSTVQHVSQPDKQHLQYAFSNQQVHQSQHPQQPQVHAEREHQETALHFNTPPTLDGFQPSTDLHQDPSLLHSAQTAGLLPAQGGGVALGGAVPGLSWRQEACHGAHKGFFLPSAAAAGNGFDAGHSTFEALANQLKALEEGPGAAAPSPVAGNPVVSVNATRFWPHEVSN